MGYRHQHLKLKWRVITAISSNIFFNGAHGYPFKYSGTFDTGYIEFYEIKITRRKIQIKLSRFLYPPLYHKEIFEHY